MYFTHFFGVGVRSWAVEVALEFAEFRSNAGAVLSRAGEREGRTAVAGRGTAAWFWGAPHMVLGRPPH